MSAISPETEKWLEVAKIAPVPELLGISGALKFPRPTIDELHDLEYAPHNLAYERKLVIEAFQARLTHNHRAQELLAGAERAADAKVEELLRNRN